MPLVARLLAQCCHPVVQTHFSRQLCRQLHLAPLFHRRFVGRHGVAAATRATPSSDPAADDSARNGHWEQADESRTEASDRSQHQWSAAEFETRDTQSDTPRLSRAQRRQSQQQYEPRGRSHPPSETTAADPDAEHSASTDGFALPEDDDALYKIPGSRRRGTSRRDQPEREAFSSDIAPREDADSMSKRREAAEEREVESVDSGTAPEAEVDRHGQLIRQHERLEKHRADAARRVRRRFDFNIGTMSSNVMQLANKITENPGVLAAQKASDKKTFSELGIHPTVVKVLQVLNVTSPTEIQRLIAERVLQGESFIASAETGSGKTLSYLAPLVSRLHTINADQGFVTELRHPRVIVLQPSVELVEQCHITCMALQKGCDFRCVKLTPGTRLKAAHKRLMVPADMIITSPETLLIVAGELDALPLSFSDTTTVVVDECDTMVDKHFEELLGRVKNLIQRDRDLDTVQWIFTGATVPDEAVDRMRGFKSDIPMIKTEATHKPLQNVSYDFIRSLNTEDRLEKCMDLLRATRTVPGQSLVFCNTKASCDKVTKVLSTRGFNCIKLHSGCNLRERKERYSLFNSGEVQILVCTDVVGRGLDTMKVSHVINMDFPEGMAEFLHRSGRVGRVGTKLASRCTSFVSSRRNQRAVSIIKECITKNLPLPKIEMW